MKLVLQGVSRTVFLIGPYAVKIPAVHHNWKCFLSGLLANMQETAFAKTGWPELCPIKFSLPGGFLVVMYRVRVMTEEEFERFDYVGFIFKEDYQIPAEPKADSFGFRPDGSIVVIDYGS
jgi:hypothetical protein